MLPAFIYPVGVKTKNLESATRRDERRYHIVNDKKDKHMQNLNPVFTL